MNNCLYCGKEVKNKYCNVSCQNKHQNKDKSDKKYGDFLNFIVICNKCGQKIEVKEREKLFPQKKKYYCSRKCSNSRNWDDNDKIKKSNSLKGMIRVERVITKCKNCKKEFEHIKSKKRIFCSKSCSTTFNNKITDRCKKGGLKSCNIQKEIRRSKNEIYFAELCKKEFNNVLTNEQIFDGWDADVILEEHKIAIMWNGKWHYEKIMEGHSVKQVQNRDKIKNKEIKNKGYKPYIIKDMGRYNKEFVGKQFEKFKNICGIV